MFCLNRVKNAGGRYLNVSATDPLRELKGTVGFLLHHTLHYMDPPQYHV